MEIYGSVFPHFLVRGPAFGRIDGRQRPSQKVFPFRYDQHDFPNGLRLITIPTDTPNVVALYIVVQTGSRNEVEAGKTRLRTSVRAHDVSGHARLSARKYDKFFKSAGAASNAYTTDDQHRLSHMFSKEDLDNDSQHGGRSLPDFKYRASLLQDGDTRRAGRVQQEQLDPAAKLSEVLRDTAFDRTPISTPRWAS